MLGWAAQTLTPAWIKNLDAARGGALRRQSFWGAVQPREGPTILLRPVCDYRYGLRNQVVSESVAHHRNLDIISMADNSMEREEE